MNKTKEPIQIFMDLVKIQSPLMQTGDIQLYLFEFFKNLFSDSETETDIITDEAGRNIAGYEAGNLIIRIAATPGCEHLPPLAIEAHVDTVPTTGDVIPFIEDGKVWSKGSNILGADNKSGVAAACAVAQSLKNTPHGPTEFIFSVGEEFSMYGMKDFSLENLNSKTVLCTDGLNSNTIFNGCLGKIKYKAHFHGTTGHSAWPEKTINAAVIAACGVEWCDKMGLLGRIDDTGNTMHAVSEIMSHTGDIMFPSTNVVPAKTTVCGELRGLTPASLKKAWEKIESGFRGVTKERGGKIEIETEIPYPPFTLPEDTGIAKRFVERNPDRNFKFEIALGSTHANVLNQRGIETIVIGCGCRDPHQYSEHLVIKDFLESIENITNYLKA